MKGRKFSRDVFDATGGVGVSVEGGSFCLEPVNAAYTSPTCPRPPYGFAPKDNRDGDRFHVPPCG